MILKIGINGFCRIGRHAELKSIANFIFIWNKGLQNFSLLSLSLLGGKKLFKEELKVWIYIPVVQKYDLYIFSHSLGCRSPPSVLVFRKKNKNGGLENEKD